MDAHLWGPKGDFRLRSLLDTGALRTLISPKRLAQVGVDLKGLRYGFAMTTVSGMARAPLVAAPGLAAFGVLRREFEVVACALPPSAPFDMKAGELTVEG